MLGGVSLRENSPLDYFHLLTTPQKYRTLDEHSKVVVDYLIESEYKRVKMLTKQPKPRMLKLDWYMITASASTVNILDSDLAEKLLVPESAEPEQALSIRSW